MRYLLSVLIAIAIAPLPVWGATYYVSPDGTTTWPNCTSQSTPCEASLTSKEFLGASAGDTVIFLDGDYTGISGNPGIYRSIWEPTKSGTAANPITFKSQNLHGAHLKGVTYGTQVVSKVFGVYAQDYIVIDGFLVSSVYTGTSTPSMATIYLYDSIGSVVTNVKVRGGTHNTGGSINYGGITIQSCTDIVISHCEVYDFVESTSNSMNTSGILTFRNTNSTIANCYVHSNSGSGIYLKGNPAYYTTVENNWLNNNYTSIVVTHKYAGEENHYLTFNNNLITNGVFDKANIGLVTGGTTSENTIWSNNTFYGGRNGVNWISAATTGAEVFNNIFYGASNSRVMTGVPIGTTDSHLKYSDYNSFPTTMQVVMREYAATAATYNTLAAWQSSGELVSGGNPDINSISGNPLFEDTSGTMLERDDFFLSSSSPAIGAGLSGADMGADISNVGPVWMFDATSPTRSSGSPSGELTAGTTSTTLSLSTAAAATCKYGTVSGTAYASIANTFSTTGGTTHSQSLTGLTNGSSYAYYVRCDDGAGGVNTSDYPISFSIAEAVVNGACGINHEGSFAEGTLASNTAGNCSTGTVDTFSGTGPWTWDCVGSGTGATDASCSASLQVVGGGTGRAPYSATARVPYSATKFARYYEEVSP